MKDLNVMKKAIFAKIEESRKLVQLQETRSDKKLTSEEQRRFDDLNAQITSDNLDLQEETAKQNNEKRELIAGRNGGMPTGKEYRSMFPGRAGSCDPDEAKRFFTVLETGKFDDVLNIRAAQEGSGPLGGFAVPEETAAIMWDRALEDSIIRPRAQIWPMISDTRTTPAFQSQDTSASVYGFVGAWLGELQEATVEDPLLRSIKHVAKKLAIFTALSREIMADGAGFQTQLTTALTKALAYFQDVAYLTGSGVGEPLGAMNCPCAIKVKRATANQIYYSDITNMFSRLLNGSYKNAVWLINETALPQVLTIQDGSGSNIVKNLNDGLLGLPIIVSEKVPTIGSAGDIGLYDFSCYSIGQRAEIAVDTTNAFKWTNDRLDVRAIIRVDGQGIFSQPVKNKQGNLVSPFVLLDSVVA